MRKTWDEIRAEQGKMRDYYADSMYVTNPMKHHSVVSELIEHGEISMNMKGRTDDKVHC